MLERPGMPLNRMVDTLKAAAESSRLRILVLLSRGDLTVSDLTEILNQSQPRVSRHLKLLLEANLIDRYQEGSWAYFHLSEAGVSRELIDNIVGRINVADAQIERDMERLAQVKERRRERATAYFDANAGEWDTIRSLHAPDAAVEAALRRLVGGRPFQAMLDLGTGTGRMLELFAGHYRRGVGVDTSRGMLAIARTNLDEAGITYAQVRQGDIYAPPVERDQFDLITIHQVLHYLEDPGLAIQQAARLLRPAGRLVIVDFAPHHLDFLREEHAHLRLGFSDEQIAEWLSAAGLEVLDPVRIDDKGMDNSLTVRIWTGRDRRLLIADEERANISTETA